MFRDTTEESRRIWEANAAFWDEQMGDESNAFHRDVVRPHTVELLDIQPGDTVLDIACGNGNFSQYLAERGAIVTAFDYSLEMIARARRRRKAYASRISFHVCDATDYDQIMSLKGTRPFTKAVSNMAVMDISDIGPLLQAVYELLADGGVFVFSSQHPCFVTRTDGYLSPCLTKDIAIEGQPLLQNYYHRSFTDIFAACFSAGFVIDGFYEESPGGGEIPAIFLVRLRKPAVKAGSCI